MNDKYNELLTAVHDKLCTALTAYEAAEDSLDYDKGYALYEEIVDIENFLSSFLN